ncbi:MAG TPA: DNRLRE domain-containing protein [Actinomycetota bacterium]|nr:DNRLRE domain-containing protein [Actinomycetota bacterium]
MRARAGVLISLALLAAAVAVPASAEQVALNAVADAWVLATSPTANKGSTTGLRILGDVKVAYLRFEVPELPAGTEVGRAVLRIYATSASTCPLGAEVLRAAADDWGETTITWSTQPGPAGPVLATATWAATGYQDFDVTAAIAGPGPVSFLLRHPPGCAASGDTTFRSREARRNRPQLVLETAAPATGACSDGVDNDGDGLVDFPADPGCVDASDAEETDPPPPPEGAHVVAATGDIVCDPSSSAYAGSNPAVCQHRGTAALLVGADVVLPLGDLQYTDGTLEKFTVAYDPTWGQHADRTSPVPGNHEYNDPAGGAAGYYGYWSSKGRPTGVTGAGYYSFDVGSWHLIGLNSNCSLVPCAEGSPQNDFLALDLASTTQPCILAYWHHPLFNSGAVHGANEPSGARAFWEDLYAARADIVLNGHEHNYQRYAKQDPFGVPAPDGIREFVVGTGGRSLYGMLDTKDANFEFGDAAHFGVLLLYLGPDSYTWRFVDPSGAVLDAGGPVPCN